MPALRLAGHPGSDRRSFRLCSDNLTSIIACDRLIERFALHHGLAFQACAVGLCPLVFRLRLRAAAIDIPAARTGERLQCLTQTLDRERRGVRVLGKWR